jgi:predicted CXXCH cytochrome family protein
MKLDILTPHDSGPGTDNSLEREGFCLNCHSSGGVSNIDIDAQFNGLTNDWLITGNDGNGSPINGRHDVMPADQAVSGGVVTCKNCHSPHADNDASPAMMVPGDHVTPIGNYSPTSSYVTAGPPAYDYSYNNGTNQDPVNPQGLGGSGRTEPDYIKFCLTCHDGNTPAGVTMPAGMIDIASSYQLQDHHGRINGGDAGQGYLKYPWNTNGATSDPSTPYAAFNCTVCHGPHGSENIYNLRESVTVAGVQMRVGGWTGDDIGNPRAPYDCSTPGDPATCSTTYILPPMDGRNINDNTGLQEDRYWGAWCSFCHQMEQHGQAEDNRCRSGHIHGGGNF